MRKITEVLRLKAAGLSVREIAASVGAGRTTVCEYLARAEAAGICWPLPDDVDDEALDAMLFPPPTPRPPERPVPDWREVHKELQVQAPRHLAPVVAGVERDPPRRLGLQPVLLALPPLARHQGRRHAPLATRPASGCSSTSPATRRRSSTPRPARSTKPRCSWPCSAARGCSTSRRRGARTCLVGGRPRPRLGDLRRRGRGHRPRQPEVRGDQGLLLRPRAQPHLRRAGQPLRDRRVADAGGAAPGQGGGRSRRADRRALGAGAAAQPDVLLAGRAQRGHRRAGGGGEHPAVPGRADVEGGPVRGARTPRAAAASGASATSWPSGRR